MKSKLIAVFLVIQGTVVHSATVVLKDGRVIYGKFENLTESKIELEVSGSNVVIPKSEVSYMDLSSGSRQFVEYHLADGSIIKGILVGESNGIKIVKSSVGELKIPESILVKPERFKYETLDYIIAGRSDFRKGNERGYVLAGLSGVSFVSAVVSLAMALNYSSSLRERYDSATFEKMAFFQNVFYFSAGVFLSVNLFNLGSIVLDNEEDEN